MEIFPDGALTALFFAMAVLYSLVGQGGGSGYLASMALVGISTENMRFTALSLNVMVTAISLWKFSGAGYFDRKLLAPFVLASVPAAFLGGAMSLPPAVFKPIVGLTLLWAAFLLFRKPTGGAGNISRPGPGFALRMGTGAAIGLLSGLVGIGGGIFLAPVLILTGWADAKVTAALSSAFILVNSVAGLAGVVSHSPSVPSLLMVWLLVVAVGGWVGSHLGAHKLSPKALQWILAVILVLGGAKMILPG
jgi:uncharacterized membrane protein YfcA